MIWILREYVKKRLTIKVEEVVMLVKVRSGLCSRSSSYVIIQRLPLALLSLPPTFINVQWHTARGTGSVLLQPRAQTGTEHKPLTVRLTFKYYNTKVLTIAGYCSLMEKMSTGQLACCSHWIPADGTIIVISQQLIRRCHSKPAQGEAFMSTHKVCFLSACSLLIHNTLKHIIHMKPMFTTLRIFALWKLIIFMTIKYLNMTWRVSLISYNNVTK